MAFGDEDLAAIFSDAGEFSVLGTFDIGGTPLEVYGVFTDKTEGQVLFGQVEVEASDASFACQTSDIASVKPRMKLTVNSVQYTVEKINSIGTGVSLIYLKT